MKKVFLILSIILPFLGFSQKSKSDLPNYSKLEMENSLKILDIEEKIFGKNPDFNSLEKQLLTIVKQTPQGYSNSFPFKSTVFVKFWSNTEFESYKKNVNKQVEYLQNVYPYAHFLLGVIYIERGQFEDAESILKKGLILEKDQPVLINELAYLNQVLFSVTKEKKNLEESSKLFEKALNSRVYNTNAQKARSLRGMGYNEFEIQNYSKAISYYEKSLEFEESPVARKEIQLLNEKLSGVESNVYNAGSNLRNKKQINSYAYFAEEEKKINEKFNVKIPSYYVYLWSKAADYLMMGSEKFREQDYFKFPMKTWNINQIDAASEQVVHFLKGVAPEHAIKIRSMEEVYQFMATYHFEFDSEQIVGNQVHQIKFIHKVDKESLTLFFILEN